MPPPTAPLLVSPTTITNHRTMKEKDEGALCLALSPPYATTVTIYWYLSIVHYYRCWCYYCYYC